MTDMRPGLRVCTSLGLGTVVYVRMAPPSYATVAAVSVKLDAQPSGAGVIFLASEVIPDSA